MIAKRITHEPGLAFSGLGLALLIFILALAGCAPRTQTVSEPSLTLRFNDGNNAFEVLGLDARNLEALKNADWTQERWTALLAVHVGTSEKDKPAVVGKHRVDGILHFDPQFPLLKGVRYQALFDPSQLPFPPADAQLAQCTVMLPTPLDPPLGVAWICPTADTLPENQMKFYIHFWAPMSRGDAFEHIRLLDSDGKRIESPFYELAGEHWDERQQRFTLFLHPGRAKPGLKLREELGPVLEAGKQYTLVIDGNWPDADGNPSKKSFRKSFKAGPPELQPVDPKKWKITAPRVGTTDPVQVTFEKPLDDAHLRRMLWIIDRTDKRVALRIISTFDHETRWGYSPAEPWMAGEYRLVVDRSLEDLAGNSVGQVFELDQFRVTVTEQNKNSTLLPFTVSQR